MVGKWLRGVSAVTITIVCAERGVEPDVPDTSRSSPYWIRPVQRVFDDCKLDLSSSVQVRKFQRAECSVVLCGGSTSEQPTSSHDPRA